MLLWVQYLLFWHKQQYLSGHVCWRLGWIPWSWWLHEQLLLRITVKKWLAVCNKRIKMMFISSPNAGMHCQKCFSHARHPGAVGTAGKVGRVGQEDWCDHNPMTVWPWFISAPKWVSLSNVLWGCLYLRGQQLWARKQQGCIRHQVSACKDTCMHPSVGKTTQCILFISLLAGRDLELWHGSLEYENHLSSVSVHICYLGRLGYAHFLACLQQDTI